MIVLVVGAGAVGSFLGGTLAAAGQDVILLRRRVPAVRAESLTLRDTDGRDRVVTVTSVGSAGDVPRSPALILLAVKMPDVPTALEVAATWPEATILAVQNGVGVDDLIVSQRATGGIIAGSLTASIATDGSAIRRLSRGGIGLAGVRGDVDAESDALVVAFAAGGLRARRYPDARAMRWSKLLANLVANATSAILDMDPAEIYGDPGLFAIERRQSREALRVMRALGLRPVALPGADTRLIALAARLPAAIVRPVMRRVVAAGRGGKSPSLRTGLATGTGPTEVDWLNGAVARAASTIGRRAPVNARLAELVEACVADPDRRAWFRRRPDRLLEVLAEREVG